MTDKLPEREQHIIGILECQGKILKHIESLVGDVLKQRLPEYEQAEAK